jgi:hypothetical protein
VFVSGMRRSSLRAFILKKLPLLPKPSLRS